jgi:hypothetical protein
VDVSLDAGITYTGSVYLLPYQRGIVLEELEVADRPGATAVSLEELLESLLGGVGRYQLDIRVAPQRGAGDQATANVVELDAWRRGHKAPAAHDPSPPVTPQTAAELRRHWIDWVRVNAHLVRAMQELVAVRERVLDADPDAGPALHATAAALAGRVQQLTELIGRVCDTVQHVG